MTTYQDLGLAKPNFILNPVTDSGVFARPDVKPGQLSESLQIDLNTHVAPKRVFFGPYGSGKTHTLFATVKLLEDHEPVCRVYVECPDLPRSATFRDFYRDGVMRVLGQSFVCDVFTEYIQQKMAAGPRPMPELLPELKRELGDEALASAVLKLYTQAFPALLFWSWFSGVPVKGADLKALEQTQDLTSAEPAILANMIIALATVVRKVRGQFMVLMLDELERMKNVNPDGQQTFSTAFSRLADQNQTDMCVLFGVSVEQLRDAGYIFSGASPVTSRWGEESEIRVPGMDSSYVPGFIREVIKYVRLRDDSRLYDLIRGAREQYPHEQFSDDIFPFSDEALEAIRVRLGAQNLPREITYFMTRALGRAMLRGHGAILKSDTQSAEDSK